MTAELDMFGAPVPVALTAKQRKELAQGYARRPGSGPVGETCGTCANCYASHYNRKTYYKCEVIRHRWTNGPGTDIRKKSPACDLWQPYTP